MKLKISNDHEIPYRMIIHPLNQISSASLLFQSNFNNFHLYFPFKNSKNTYSLKSKKPSKHRLKNKEKSTASHRRSQNNLTFLNPFRISYCLLSSPLYFLKAPKTFWY